MYHARIPNTINIKIDEEDGRCGYDQKGCEQICE